jgi:hypothetical protein
MRAYAARRRAARKAQGICLNCDAPVAGERSKVYCLTHLLRQTTRSKESARRVRAAKRAKRAPRVGMTRKEIAAKEKSRRDTRIAAGLCARCGEARGEEGTSRHCRPCADNLSDHQRTYNQQRRTRGEAA